MIGEITTYLKLSAALARWSRQAPEPDPRGLVLQTLERRAENFLSLMKAAVFRNPTNPFHSLFQWAGCACEDLAAMVRKDGLGAALEALYRAGVYLSHDEFKAKKPVVRGGRQLTVSSASLANPLFKGVVETSSSGSRSTGTITRRSLEYQRYREAQERVMTAGYESEGRALVMMGAILPATGALRRVLKAGRRGRPPDKWFSIAGGFRSAGHYRAVTHLMLVELRWLGVPAIFPEYLPRNDFAPVARWIAERKQAGVPCLVIGGVSRGVRVAAAALEHGLDIRGTLFLLGGEALTDAKLAVIEAAGGGVGEALVTAVRLGTGETRTATTARDGTYRLMGLEVGQYAVSVERAGFKTSRHDGIRLEVDRTAVVDFQLEIGDRLERMVVTGQARLIEATPSALSSLVDAHTIEQLPLNGRDYLQLAVLQAGAPVARAQDRNINLGFGLQLSISGSRPFQNAFRLDGLTTTYNGSTPASRPSSGAISSVAPSAAPSGATASSSSSTTKRCGKRAATRPSTRRCRPLPAAGY